MVATKSDPGIQGAQTIEAYGNQGPLYFTGLNILAISAGRAVPPTSYLSRGLRLN